MWSWFILAGMVGWLVVLWSAYILARAAGTYSPDEDER